MHPTRSTTANARTRNRTATSRFGSSRRESHDATAFYARFVAPAVSDDTTVVRPRAVDVVYEHDARDMHQVESSSVALVVTSPPYFAGKEYEASLGQDGVPATYFEYLALLRDVFAECRRVLEPGGRIAVNVANLGRKPYRSLAGDVTDILQGLGLLLRGEIVWVKGRAAGGSCAWGSFQRPANPVLRDVTERIVLASKDRFSRALDPEERLARGLPSTTTISREEFLEATTDLWELPPERATRVGHPAPFPVALPQRLIELFTYEHDVVLDPFMGSGSTAVAAVRTNRHYIGFDTDPAYVERARARVQEELATRRGRGSGAAARVWIPAGAAGHAAANGARAVEEAVRAGRSAKEVARLLLEEAGFSSLRANVKVPRVGITLDFVAQDALGHEWAFDVNGTFTSHDGGLARGDMLWPALGRAAVLREMGHSAHVVLMSTAVPRRGTSVAAALQAMTGPGRPVASVLGLLDPDTAERLRALASGAPAASHR